MNIPGCMMNNLRKILIGFLAIAFASASFCCLSMSVAEEEMALPADFHKDTSDMNSHSCCPSTPKENNRKCNCRGESPVLKPETIKNHGRVELLKLKHSPVNFSVRLADDLDINDPTIFQSFPENGENHKPGPVYLLNRVLRL